MNIQAEIKAYLIHNGVLVLEVNDAFCELFRNTPDSISGQPVDSIVASEDLRALARLRVKHIVRYFEEHPERVFRQEYDFLRCDGSCFWGLAETHFLEPGRYLTLIEWSYDIHEF